jgi:hypothetical protein
MRCVQAAEEVEMKMDGQDLHFRVATICERDQFQQARDIVVKVS